MVVLAGVVLDARDPEAVDVVPDDTAGTPTSGMLIGVGSDTIQHVDKLVSDAYNLTSPAARHGHGSYQENRRPQSRTPKSHQHRAKPPFDTAPLLQG